MKDQLGNPALPRLLIVNPAVYPRLILAIFSYKSRPTQLRILKPRYDHSRGSPEFPNQNLSQGDHDIQTNRQTGIATLCIDMFSMPWFQQLQYILFNGLNIVFIFDGIGFKRYTKLELAVIPKRYEPSETTIYT